MKPSSLNSVREMYEAHADSYDQMMDKEIQLPVYTKVLGRLHKSIESTPGHLIDTSCGSGHMLDMYHSLYDPTRTLIGIDLSPRMVAISKKRLGKKASLMVGDMRLLPMIEPDSAAAVINFFAIHHVDLEGLNTCMLEWNRILVSNGHLFLAAWEGSGAIDYGGDSDIVALRYTREELIHTALETGYLIDQCYVEPVAGFPMDAVYLECRKESS